MFNTAVNWQNLDHLDLLITILKNVFCSWKLAPLYVIAFDGCVSSKTFLIYLFLKKKTFFGKERKEIENCGRKISEMKMKQYEMC